MKLALSLCLSFLLAVPQLASANAAVVASIGAIAAISGNNSNSNSDRGPRPPRLADEIVARGFVATSQAQCEARKSAIHVSAALCTKAFEIARKEHAALAPVYRRAADCAAEHAQASCVSRAAISKKRHEIQVFQPAFSGALIFKTPDDRFGVNAVMAGHRSDAWTRAGFQGVAHLDATRDSFLPSWLVVDHGLFSAAKPTTRSRMAMGGRADEARAAGCAGYGYAMTEGGHCPLDRWLSPAN